MAIEVQLQLLAVEFKRRSRFGSCPRHRAMSRPRTWLVSGAMRIFELNLSLPYRGLGHNPSRNTVSSVSPRIHNSRTIRVIR